MIRSFASIVLALSAALLLGTLAAHAQDEVRIVLTPVPHASAADLVGPTHRMFFEPDGKGWIILFRSAEVASRTRLGAFSGVWLAEERTGLLKVFRFDTQEGIQFSLFSSPGLSHLALGYRLKEGGAWHFLLPEQDVLQNPSLVLASLEVRR